MGREGEHAMYGRERELGVVADLLRDARAACGAALAVHGHAGIGKTTLLAAAGRMAAQAGMTVLHTGGVPAEAALPFAGLHRLLAPLRGDLHELTPRLRRTLRGAFGEEEVRPDLFSVGLAVLELLGDSAARRPVLLLADDVHWLDPETRDVLLFVARRLGAEPIAAVLAAGAAHPGALPRTEFAQLELGELDDAAARRLLHEHAPGLAPGLRDRLLAEAAGNPLALVELPRLVTGAPRGGTVVGGPAYTELLPLNDRLETAFTDRVAQQPAGTRAVLTVLAAEPGCPLPVLLAIAGTLTGEPVAAAALQPAIDAGLLQIQAQRLRFRHPLVRSAVYRSAGDIVRLTIHAAIAETLDSDQDRRAWHRSAATLGPDETVSGDLEAAAGRALERGAAGAAVTGLDRAAALTGDPGRRTSLLLRAADLAVQLHDRRVAARLIARTDPAPGDVTDRARLTLVRDLVEPGDLRDTSRVDLLGDRALDAHAAGATGLAAALTWRAAARCWWACLPGDSGAQVATVLGKLDLADDDPQALAIGAHAQPDGYGPEALRRLRTLIPDRTDVDAMRHLGGAALVLGDFVTAASYLSTAAAGYRAQGRVTLLAPTLAAAGLIRPWLGHWLAARADLQEAQALAEETGDPVWAVTARAGLALHEAMTGNGDTAVRLADGVLADTTAAGARFAAALAQHARGVAVNATGRHDEALAMLLRLCDPADPSHHRDVAGWALPDLADAAVRAGRREDVAAAVGSARDRAAGLPSPMLHRCLAYADAVLADDEDAGSAFAHAYTVDVTAWPVHRARLDLAYGTWLRRRRRILQSRPVLRAARDGFDALGVHAWGRLARAELRAAGEESAGRAVRSGERLTSQELQTAILAAAGLSNREIGQRLFLSHRTVSSHLYRIYPKLGISGRAQLRGALEALRHSGSDAVT